MHMVELSHLIDLFTTPIDFWVTEPIDFFAIAPPKNRHATTQAAVGPRPPILYWWTWGPGGRARRHFLQKLTFVQWDSEN